MTIQEAIDKFIADVQLRPSKETPHTYAGALKAFERYLRQARVDPTTAGLDRLTVEHFLDVPHYLKGEHFRGRANDYTITTYLSVYLSWLRFLIREDLQRDLGRQSERIRAMYKDLRPKGRRLPRAIKDADVEAIVAAAQDKPRQQRPRLEMIRLRDIALIESLRCTGARIGEIVGANVEDLEPSERSLRITGKGNKQRLLFFDARGWKALTTYLKGLESLKVVRTGKTTPLLRRHSRTAGQKLQRLSQRSARNIVQALAKRARVRERVTPHRFRHAYGRRVLERTGDLAATQDLLGHASPVTTRIYAHLISSRLREAHQKAFPS